MTTSTPVYNDPSSAFSRPLARDDSGVVDGGTLSPVSSKSAGTDTENNEQHQQHAISAIYRAPEKKRVSLKGKKEELFFLFSCFIDVWACRETEGHLGVGGV